MSDKLNQMKDETIEKLKEKIRIYEEALNYYSDDNNFNLEANCYNDDRVFNDYGMGIGSFTDGKRARKALEDAKGLG